MMNLTSNNSVLACGLIPSQIRFSGHPELVGNVLLSLGSISSSTFQLGFGGQAIEIFMDSDIFSGTSRIPFSLEFNQWYHLGVVYNTNFQDGYELKLYLNGSLIGESGDFGGEVRNNPSHQWLLGGSETSSSNEGQFIGKVDDLRIFSTILTEQEIAGIYNSGLGDFSLTVETVDLNPTFDALKTDNISIGMKFKKFGSFLDLDEMELPDINFTLLSPTDFDDATLWLDATVEDSIEVDEFGFVDSWENLLDGSVKLYSENNKPINGASLNGRNAIDFNFGEDEAGNAYYDSMSAKTTGGQDWSALSSDGSIGGSYSDVTIFIVFQVDTNQRQPGLSVRVGAGISHGVMAGFIMILQDG